MNHATEGHDGTFLASRTRLVLLGFPGAAVFLLLTEHRAHVLGAVLWLLPLGCVFMHMFMHGGHHHGIIRQRRTIQRGRDEPRLP